MIKRIILLTLNFITLTSWGALRDFGSPEKGSFSHSPLRAQLRTLQESLEMAPAAPLRIQDYVSVSQAAPQSPFLLLNDHVLTQQPEVADMLNAECVLAPSQTQDRRQSALARVLVFNDTAPQSDRLFRQLRALQASLPQPAGSTVVATAFPEEAHETTDHRHKRACTAHADSDIPVEFLEADTAPVQPAPPSPAKKATEKATKAVKKAQRKLEQLEKAKAERYQECIDALREIQAELDRGDSCNVQTVTGKILPKIKFLINQCETSTDQKFIDSVHHLQSVIMGTLTVLATSPVRPTQAQKTHVTPKRPKTPREVAEGVQRVFNLDENPGFSHAREGFAALTPPAGSLHERILPGLNVRHIEESHVISDMPALIKHNTSYGCGVYISRNTGVVCATNPYVYSKPQKTFFPLHIATDNADDHVIGKILLTLHTPRAERHATQDSDAIPDLLELFYSHEFKFPFVLVTREKYKKGCLQGVRKRSQTMYPIFSLTTIDESTLQHIRLVDAEVMNATDIKQNPQLIIDMDLPNLLALVIAMKNDATYKNDHFVSVDPEYIVVDIARYLHTHVGCPIEHGIIVRIKKTLLPSDY